MVVLGAGMFLVALNGAIHIWHGTDGPTDFANMVLGLFAAVIIYGDTERPFNLIIKRSRPGPIGLCHSPR
jgi:hypothetical protein